jgi:hypothetical protein
MAYIPGVKEDFVTLACCEQDDMDQKKLSCSLSAYLVLEKFGFSYYDQPFLNRIKKKKMMISMTNIHFLLSFQRWQQIVVW